MDEAQTERVEVTIICDAATYAKIVERLDALVMEYDLNTTVVRTPNTRPGTPAR